MKNLMPKDLLLHVIISLTAWWNEISFPVGCYLLIGRLTSLMSLKIKIEVGFHLIGCFPLLDLLVPDKPQSKIGPRTAFVVDSEKAS